VSDAETPEVDGNRKDATAHAVLTYLVGTIVEDETSVEIETESRRNGGVGYHVSVAPSDMGRIIGRRGRVAQAVRTVVRAAGARDGVEVHVDIDD
jgi:predicted RNA-binding protein YlqC (UPF0109 family)